MQKSCMILNMKPRKVTHGSARKIPPNRTAQKLKAAGIGPVDLPLRKGSWQIAREKGLPVPGQPKTKVKGTKPLALTDEEKHEMVMDRESGMTVPQLSSRYGVSRKYVADALKQGYVTMKEGKTALRGVLLEGALACGQQAKVKIDELNGMQSVVAAGIFTQRFIDMDKHLQESPEEVDMSDVEKAGALLSSLETEQEGVLLEDHREATIDLDDEE